MKEKKIQQINNVKLIKSAIRSKLINDAKKQENTTHDEDDINQQKHQKQHNDRISRPNLNNTLLNNPCIKEQITREMKKYVEWNENKKQNL